MRVIREKRGGFWHTAVVGTPAVPPSEVWPRHWESVAKQRAQIGRLVGFSLPLRRKPQNLGRGLPRNRTICTSVDTEAFARLDAEAERRGLTKAGLLGAILDACIDDDLFNAVLGEPGKPVRTAKRRPRRAGT